MVAQIVAEGELIEKRDCVVPTRLRRPSRPQPMRVHEATTEKKAPAKQQPYEPRKPETRNQGAHEGGGATKAQLPSRIEGTDRCPQHSGETQDARKDWLEVGAEQERLVRVPPNRMYGFKLEGGEWFKEGFRKLLSLE